MLNTRSLVPERTDFAVEAEDGYEIAATIWHSTASFPARCVAIINSGAGIPAKYYGPFGAWLASQGTDAITYDYRGIGRSRPASLKGFRASVVDWGSKDCASVVQWAGKNRPNARIALVGHSIGGFLAGFMKEGSRISRLVFVAGHTGYWGDYRSTYRIPMYVLWHIAMPIVNSAMGYFPASRIGFPADIPFGVAREWANRRHPNFWCDSMAKHEPEDMVLELRGRFAAFQAGALTITLKDDPFATDQAAKRLEQLFCRCRFHHEPSIGGWRIGHFGFFRRAMATTLWPIVGDWLWKEG